MIRKKILKKLYLTTLICFVLFIVTFFSWNKQSLVTPSVNYGHELTNIYLLNKNNYLTEVGILIDDDDINNSIKTVINNLKTNNKLYGSLRGLIPTNTHINKIEYKDNIINIDFNKEFLNTNLSLEEKLIESVLYSLLNLKDVYGVKISIEGEKLLKLPQSNILLKEILDKTFGINKEYNLIKTNDIQRVVLYYYDEIDENNYYIPITKYINNKDDKVKIIIDNLKNSYIYKTNLMSYVNKKVELLNYEIDEKTVTLNFSHAFMMNDDNIEEEIIYTISNSIFNSMNIDKVIYEINGEILLIKSRKSLE